MSDIVSQLKTLKLHGMADRYTELQSQGTAAIGASEWLIQHLLEAEATDRAIRSISYQMGLPSFLCIGVLRASISVNPKWIGR